MRPANSGFVVSMPESTMPMVTPCPLAPAAHAVIAPCCDGPVERLYSAVWNWPMGWA
jgi:hypothetical protein